MVRLASHGSPTFPNQWVRVGHYFANEVVVFVLARESFSAAGPQRSKHPFARDEESALIFLVRALLLQSLWSTKIGGRRRCCLRGRPSQVGSTSSRFPLQCSKEIGHELSSVRSARFHIVYRAAPRNVTDSAFRPRCVCTYLGSTPGSLLRPDREPTGQISVTFLIYKDQNGGEPLFAETQAVATDATGRYKVQLGAANPNGLPSDLFSSGEARWLEVQIAGEPAQPRVLLASVPYALKAADAATLGGLPASAFALAGSGAVANVTPAAITPTLPPQ